MTALATMKPHWDLYSIPVCYLCIMQLGRPLLSFRHLHTSMYAWLKLMSYKLVLSRHDKQSEVFNFNQIGTTAVCLKPTSRNKMESWTNLPKANNGIVSKEPRNKVKE